LNHRDKGELNVSTITSNISKTLNGSTPITIGTDTYQWFDRWLDSLSIYAPTDAPLRTVKLTFSGHTWGASILRVEGNANTIINDTSTGTTDDNRVTIEYIKVGASGTNTIILRNAEVDIIDGNRGAEKVIVGSWAGHVNLGRGDDTVTVTGVGEVSTMDLGRGNDTLTTTDNAWVGSTYTGRGNDVVSLGAAGAHFIHMGQDADIVKISANSQGAVLHGGNGISDDLAGAKDSDTVDFSAFTIGVTIDLNGRRTVEGTHGEFVISNFENATGGKGKDTFIANDVANIFKGGTAADTFVFDTKTAAHGDKILDFSQTEKDRIDVSGMDANSVVSGEQAFTFIGTAAFSDKAGQLRYQVTSGDTIIQGDINGDGVRDFSIILDASVTLKVGDFIL
jgi:serralysin